MELRHLRYFVVVGEDQHYGLASRRLGVAQPALSRQIQDLEREIGFKLFDRMPRGQSGTLRVGFAENVSWHGVAPDSFRRFREQQPGVDLQLQPAASLEQLDAIRSGSLDAGFVNFMPKADPELDQLAVAVHHLELAVPNRHPLTK